MYMCFLKVRNHNLSFGSVLTTYFLFGLMDSWKREGQFFNELFNFHSNLKFTFETSSCTVDFFRSNCKFNEWGNT